MIGIVAVNLIVSFKDLPSKKKISLIFLSCVNKVVSHLMLAIYSVKAKVSNL